MSEEKKYKQGENREAWQQKVITLHPRPTRVAPEYGEEEMSGFDTEVEEFTAPYYAVCTNTWPSKEVNDAISMCTYVKALDCDDYQQARAIIKQMNADGVKCPYCGHSHFRIKDGESLTFDRRYVSRYFFMD